MGEIFKSNNDLCLEKYVPTSEALLNPEAAKGRIKLSDDAFAIAEMVNELIRKIEHARLTLNG